MADNAQGFGATAQTDNNSEEIARLLDQVRDLMVEDGSDPATAEALTNYARPATPAIAGNLADLNRMGQIAVTGKIDTPPGQDDEATTSIEDAFKEPPAAPLAPAGLQTPMGQIDAEGKPTGGTVGSTESAGTGTDYEGKTKAELQGELDSRSIAWNSADTKQDLIDRLNEG
ncbi:MAG: SAP domain-containing protein [Actinobacteria bacterium]|nr:SAP domain-containing protein [Actinomycetota bacterium]